ncbi:MAG: putative porin [Chloroflexota bacterium]|nr:putative porin [Chloroflexota bacterium]
MRLGDITRLDLGYFTMPDRPGHPLSGQLFMTSEFASAQVGWQLHEIGWPQPGTFPDWMDRLQSFDRVRILFAHDVAVWERGPSPPSP